MSDEILNSYLASLSRSKRSATSGMQTSSVDSARSQRRSSPPLTVHTLNSPLSPSISLYTHTHPLLSPKARPFASHVHQQLSDEFELRSFAEPLHSISSWSHDATMRDTTSRCATTKYNNNTVYSTNDTQRVRSATDLLAEIEDQRLASARQIAQLTMQIQQQDQLNRQVMQRHANNHTPINKTYAIVESVPRSQMSPPPELQTKQQSSPRETTPQRFERQQRQQSETWNTERLALEQRVQQLTFQCNHVMQQMAETARVKADDRQRKLQRRRDSILHQQQLEQQQQEQQQQEQQQQQMQEQQQSEEQERLHQQRHQQSIQHRTSSVQQHHQSHQRQPSVSQQLHQQSVQQIHQRRTSVRRNDANHNIHQRRSSVAVSPPDPMNDSDASTHHNSSSDENHRTNHRRTVSQHTRVQQSQSPEHESEHQSESEHKYSRTDSRNHARTRSRIQSDAHSPPQRRRDNAAPTKQRVHDRQSDSDACRHHSSASRQQHLQQRHHSPVRHRVDERTHNSRHHESSPDSVKQRQLKSHQHHHHRRNSISPSKSIRSVASSVTELIDGSPQTSLQRRHKSVAIQADLVSTIASAPVLTGPGQFGSIQSAGQPQTSPDSVSQFASQPAVALDFTTPATAPMSVPVIVPPPVQQPAFASAFTPASAPAPAVVPASAPFPVEQQHSVLQPAPFAAPQVEPHPSTAPLESAPLSAPSDLAASPPHRPPPRRNTIKLDASPLSPLNSLDLASTAAAAATVTAPFVSPSVIQVTASDAVHSPIAAFVESPQALIDREQFALALEQIKALQTSHNQFQEQFTTQSQSKARANAVSSPTLSQSNANAISIEPMSDLHANAETSSATEFIASPVSMNAASPLAVASSPVATQTSTPDATTRVSTPDARQLHQTGSESDRNPPHSDTNSINSQQQQQQQDESQLLLLEEHEAEMRESQIESLALIRERLLLARAFARWQVFSAESRMERLFAEQLEQHEQRKEQELQFGNEFQQQRAADARRELFVHWLSLARDALQRTQHTNAIGHQIAERHQWRRRMHLLSMWRVASQQRAVTYARRAARRRARHDAAHRLLLSNFVAGDEEGDASRRSSLQSSPRHLANATHHQNQNHNNHINHINHNNHNNHQPVRNVAARKSSLSSYASADAAAAAAAASHHRPSQSVSSRRTSFAAPHDDDDDDDDDSSSLHHQSTRRPPHLHLSRQPSSAYTQPVVIELNSESDHEAELVQATMPLPPPAPVQRPHSPAAALPQPTPPVKPAMPRLQSMSPRSSNDAVADVDDPMPPPSTQMSRIQSPKHNNNNDGATTHRSSIASTSPRVRSHAASPRQSRLSVPSPTAAAAAAAAAAAQQANAAAAAEAEANAAATAAAAFAAGEAQGLAQVTAALAAERERLAQESAAREFAIQQECDARLSAAASLSAAQLARVAQSLHALKHDAFVASRPVSIAPTPRHGAAAGGALALSPQQMSHAQLAQQLQTPRSAPFWHTSTHAQQQQQQQQQQPPPFTLRVPQPNSSSLSITPPSALQQQQQSVAQSPQQAFTWALRVNASTGSNSPMPRDAPRRIVQPLQIATTTTNNNNNTTPQSSQQVQQMQQQQHSPGIVKQLTPGSANLNAMPSFIKPQLNLQLSSRQAYETMMPILPTNANGASMSSTPLVSHRSPPPSQSATSPPQTAFVQPPHLTRPTSHLLMPPSASTASISQQQQQQQQQSHHARSQSSQYFAAMRLAPLTLATVSRRSSFNNSQSIIPLGALTAGAQLVTTPGAAAAAGGITQRSAIQSRTGSANWTQQLNATNALNAHAAPASGSGSTTTGSTLSAQVRSPISARLMSMQAMQSSRTPLAAPSASMTPIGAQLTSPSASLAGAASQ